MREGRGREGERDDDVVAVEVVAVVDEKIEQREEKEEKIEKDRVEDIEVEVEIEEIGKEMRVGGRGRKKDAFQSKEG